ncbi:Glycosyl_transferases group 1 family protein [Hexamita inflata]|uniref:Glycosyl transferases group 1 family protein n=1 Tax=Hexamita inflata TaxID=28002 RepID=A0AA86TI05_9EUKA|nr:Glycosyl transferases group 1 family protein [Hexamita inflata]
MNDGGIERVSQQLAKQLSQKGFKILLITGQPSDNDYQIPSDIERVILPHFEDEYELNYKSWEEIQQIVNQQSILMMKLQSQFNIKMFICQHCMHWSTRNYYAIQSLKRNNIPVIAVDHNFFLYPLCSEEKHLFEFTKVAYPIVDTVICLSRVDVQLWKKVGVKNAMYMPNPLTFDLEQIQLSKLETKNIILVGRFNRRHKQQHLAIMMMKKVLEEEPDAVLQLIGSGFEDYKEECRQLALELGIQNSVQFVDFQADIEAYYRNASVMVMTSAIEGFPMVLVESKSYGVPTVAFELDFCELWQEGITAVPKGDTDAMAREVVRLLQNQTFRLEKGMEARKAVEKFRTEDTINKWVRLITGIIDGNGVVKQMQAEEEKVTEERAVEIYQKELKFWGQEDLRLFD